MNGRGQNQPSGILNARVCWLFCFNSYALVGKGIKRERNPR